MPALELRARCSARFSPAAPHGRLAATAGLTLAVTLIALSNHDDRHPGETLLWALAVCSPTWWIAARGHFGREAWRFPSVGGFVYLFWQLGLAPSLCAISERAMRFAHFGDGALFYARAVHVAWFWLFAAAVGAAPDDERDATAGAASRPEGGLVEMAALVALWAAATLGAASLHRLSYWGGPAHDDRAGVDMAAPFLYGALTPLMPAVALFLRGHRARAVRVLGGALLLAALALLFVMSSRRLWVAGGVLGLWVVGSQRGRVPIAALAAWAAVSALALGPILWAYRSTVSSAPRGDNLAVAYQAASDVAADSEARERSWDKSSENVAARSDIAGVTCGVTQWVLDHGARLEGTVLSGLVRAVPSALWPDKNRVANATNARTLLLATGRFPMVDMPLSPIAELTFDLGPAAALGGLVYGALAGWAGRRARAAMRSLHGIVAWGALVIALSLFDCEASMVFGIREHLLIALGLWCIARVAAVLARPAAPGPYAVGSQA